MPFLRYFKKNKLDTPVAAIFVLNFHLRRANPPFQAKHSPGAYRRLQQRADSRHKEDGGDELALGAVVVPDAQRLGQDQWDGNDASKSQDVVLRVTNVSCIII